MTELQSMELAICFGCTIGFMLGGVISLISLLIEEHKDKKRKREEESEKQETAE